MKKRPEENAMKRMSILIFAAVFAWFGLYGAPNDFRGCSGPGWRVSQLHYGRRAKRPS